MLTRNSNPPLLPASAGTHRVEFLRRMITVAVIVSVLMALSAWRDAVAGDNTQNRTTAMPTPTTSSETPAWRHWIAYVVKGTLMGYNNVADATWRRLGDRLGFGQARFIAAYRGYANDEHVWVRGRLLGNRPYGGPQDDDTWWDNVKATLQRWESDEIPNANVMLTYAGQGIEVETDDEGYYAATFTRSKDHPDTATVEAVHSNAEVTLHASHWIELPAASARYMVISDVDDTVIHTGITDLKTAAELTFLNNAKTRKPLTGVAGLYQSLAQPEGDSSRNPVFYVSNSAWNMYDLLRDFLDLNELPRGPLLLRDLDVTDMIAGTENHHKRDSIEDLLQRIPLPAILIGDSGQHDASLYADIAARHPHRVLGIYIRDIDPDTESQYDVNVARLIDSQHLDDIPFKLVRDSSAIAMDLTRIGVLPAVELDDVAEEVEKDEQRETAPEKASEEILKPGA